MNLLYPRRFLTKKAVSLTLLLSLVITNAFAVRPVSGTGNKASNTPTSSAIYTTDLTQLGRQGRLRVSLSFEKEVNRLVEVLGKGGVRQPVIVDEKGQSQDEIVDQLAVRIAKGDVPDSLKNRTVVKLMTKVLFSNAKTPQDVDAVVNSVVDQAVASKSQTILYVDELSNFVQAAGGNAKLIDALSKGQISLIGGSIKAAFDNKIGNDTVLAALFEAINVTSDPSSNQNDKAAKTRDSESYRGDNVSPDLREMMQQDPSGKKRVDVILQAVEQGRRENVHSEEAEVVAGAQAWDVELLLGFGGRGLFEHRFDSIKALRRIHKLAADRAIVGELAFMRGLHGGDGAVFRPGNLDELLGAAFLRGAQVEMVADEQEERVFSAKRRGAMHGVRIAQRGGLLDERQAPGMRPGGGAIGRFVAGADHDADLIDPGPEDLLDDDGESGLGHAVAVDQRLKRKHALVFSSGGDEGLANFHGEGAPRLSKKGLSVNQPAAESPQADDSAYSKRPPRQAALPDASHALLLARPVTPKAFDQVAQGCRACEATLGLPARSAQPCTGFHAVCVRPHQ